MDVSITLAAFWLFGILWHVFKVPRFTTDSQTVRIFSRLQWDCKMNMVSHLLLIAVNVNFILKVLEAECAQFRHCTYRENLNHTYTLSSFNVRQPHFPHVP